MRHVLAEDELAEVRVDRHENPRLSGGPMKERPIARVGSPLARLGDVVPLTAKPLREAAPGTAIDQKPH